MKSINCKGKLIDLSRPKVMGIVNCTPDSFYDGGSLKNDVDILRTVEKMLIDGATFIDVGGYSSKPGAKDVNLEEELNRVIPVIEAISTRFTEVLISIDTFRAEVARQAVESGACMVNDISAGDLDGEMFNTILKLQVPYIMMHMQGTPQTMQNNPKYNDVVFEVIRYFSQKTNQLKNLGLNDLIIDPGFGFGKTIDQNFELLHNLSLFQSLELPILSGLSRKSMLFKLIETTPDKALNATTVANTIAIQNGANILRVHDVKEAIEAIKIVQALN